MRLNNAISIKVVFDKLSYWITMSLTVKPLYSWIYSDIKEMRTKLFYSKEPFLFRNNINQSILNINSEQVENALKFLTLHMAQQGI